MPNIVRPLAQAIPQLVRNTTRLSATAEALRPHIIKTVNRPFIAGPRSVQREGVLFAPLCTLDSFEMAAVQNRQRLMRGKSCRTLISADRQQHKLFLKHKAAYIEQCRVKLRDVHYKLLDGIRPKMQRDAAGFYVDAMLCKLQRKKNELNLMLQAAQKMEIRPNIQNKDLGGLHPLKHKLYIIGHGFAGRDSLASPTGNKEYTRANATQLSSLLKKSGLPASFRDIRVIACHSADAKRPSSFEPAVLANNRRPCAVDNGAATKLLIPFAQRLSQALYQAGFRAQGVMGYHGLGIMPEFTRDHHHRTVDLAKGERVRASTLRQRFLPELAPAALSQPKPSQS